MGKKSHISKVDKKPEIVLSKFSQEIASESLDFLHEFQSLGQSKYIS